MPTLTPTRPLGNSSVSVRPLCLGGNVFGWTIDEPTSFQILAAGFPVISHKKIPPTPFLSASLCPLRSSGPPR